MHEAALGSDPHFGSKLGDYVQLMFFFSQGKLRSKKRFFLGHLDVDLFS